MSNPKDIFGIKNVLTALGSALDKVWAVVVAAREWRKGVLNNTASEGSNLDRLADAIDSLNEAMGSDE